MLQQRGGTLVAWVDQFNKAQYSKNPATGRDISLSTTAMALIPAGHLRGHFAGHPMPDSLYSDVAQHVTGVQDAWVSFTASTKHLVRQHMGFEQVRCLLDLRHKEVEVTPRYPLAIRDVPISATFGFHRAMYGVLQLANNCSAPVLPMLCNITIYYNYLKMSHSYWMQPLPPCHVFEKAFLAAPAARPLARTLRNLPNLWSFLDSTLLCSRGGMGPGFTI